MDTCRNTAVAELTNVLPLTAWYDEALIAIMWRPATDQHGEVTWEAGASISGPGPTVLALQS